MGRCLASSQAREALSTFPLLSPLSSLLSSPLFPSPPRFFPDDCSIDLSRQLWLLSLSLSLLFRSQPTLQSEENTGSRDGGRAKPQRELERARKGKSETSRVHVGGASKSKGGHSIKLQKVEAKKRYSTPVTSRASKSASRRLARGRGKRRADSQLLLQSIDQSLQL